MFGSQLNKLPFAICTALFVLHGDPPPPPIELMVTAPTHCPPEKGVHVMLVPGMIAEIVPPPDAPISTPLPICT